MIAQIHGRVVQKKPHSAVISLGSFALEVWVPGTTLQKIHEGAEASLHTALVVREDSLTLFGFADADEQKAFEILIAISGIGPKIALAILSLYSAEELRGIVAQKNEAALTKVPGIGKKGAQRLILEIGDKLGHVPSGITVIANGADEVREQVLNGLVSLGWQETAAAKAISLALETNADQNSAELLRHALQILGGKH